MTSYSFPNLTFQAIKEELRVFQGLEITVEDLKFARPDKVKEIYKILLEEIGVNLDDINQMQFRGSENIENPEQHEKSIPLITLALKINKVMNKIGVSDFCVKDFILPDPKHLRRNISALINFWKFVESQRLPILYKILDKKKEKSMKKEALLDKKDQFRRGINRLKIKQEEELPQIKLIADSLENLSSALAEAKKIQQERIKELNSLKAEKAEAVESMESMQLKINQEQQETIKLEAMLVKSPDRVAEGRTNITKEIEMTKERIQQRNHRLQELQCDTENYKAIIIKAQCVKNILEIIQDFYKRKKDVNMESEVQENEKYLLQTKLNRMMMDMDRLKKILKSNEEKQMRLEVQHKSKMAAMRATVKDLEKEEDQLALQKSQDEVVLSQLMKDTKHMNELIEKIQDKMIAHKKELEKQFTALCQEVSKKTLAFKENVDRMTNKLKQKGVLSDISNIQQ